MEPTRTLSEAGTSVTSRHAGQLDTAGDDQRGRVVLEARDIEKRYGAVVALSGASLQIRSGEILGLVGDNGAGKSTLVKVLSGATTADAGEILLDGQPVRFSSPLEARLTGVDTVYQDLALAPPLTAWENIFLGRELLMPGLLGRLGFLDRATMRRRAHEIALGLGIDVRVDHGVRFFSGGQRQAVAISRAIVSDQRVLILDEPTAALGVRQRGKVLDFLRRLRGAAPTLGILMISHDLPHVMDITDRIAVMRHGAVVATVTTRETTAHWIRQAILGADPDSANSESATDVARST